MTWLRAFALMVMFGIGSAGSAGPAAAEPGTAAFDALSPPTETDIWHLFMAANADLLQTDAFAFDHYMIFGGEPGLDERGVIQRCLGLANDARSNEIRRVDHLADAKAFLTTKLPEIAARPTTARFRIRFNRRLGEYDGAAGRFPILESFTSPRSTADALAGFNHIHSVGHCSVVDTNRIFQGLTFRGTRFEVTGEEALVALPMARDVAEAYLDRVDNRVDIETIVEIGPIYPGTPAPVRILAARAIEPNTDNVIHVFDAGLFQQKDVAEDGDADVAASHQPATIALQTLLAIRANPSLVSEDALKDAAARQIRAEQAVLEQIRMLETVGEANDPNLFRRPLDPKRPVVYYALEEIRSSDPDFYDALLTEVFATSAPDWSLAAAREDLDPRFHYFFDALVFDPASHMGREPEFAAADLAAVYRQHLLAAAARAPTKLYVDVRLRDVSYDMASGMFTVGSGEGAQLMTEMRGNVVFSDTPLEAVQQQPRGYILPSSAETPFPRYAANMHFLRDGERLREPSGTEFDARFGIVSNQPAFNNWRASLAGLRLQQGILIPDRVLTLSGFSAPRATVEARLREDQFYLSHPQLTARIRFDVERVEAGIHNSGPQNNFIWPVMFVAIEGIDIFDRSGAQLATIDPDAFVGKEEMARRTSAERQAQDAEAGAIDAKRQALANADIVGLRMGMTVAEAERLINDRMDVKWVSELSDAKRASLNENRPYHDFRLYSPADGKEQIALFTAPKGNEVLAIGRSVQLPAETPQEALMSQLRAKYGDTPFGILGGAVVWTADPGTGVSGHSPDRVFRDGGCYVLLKPLSSSDLQHVDGLPLREAAQARGEQFSFRGWINPPALDVFGGANLDPQKNARVWDPQTWSACGPTVIADIADIGDGFILNVMIYDLKAYAAAYAASVAPAAAADAPLPDL